MIVASVTGADGSGWVADVRYCLFAWRWSLVATGHRTDASREEWVGYTFTRREAHQHIRDLLPRFDPPSKRR